MARSSSSGAAEPPRDMLFVSHANPEDNTFARWIALRLAAAGYPVWCDLTQLLGGERFWNDIEVALRTRTVKFLFVLSRISNEKTGPRDELDLALKVQGQLKLPDFVIPLWIDDLPASDFNIRLGGTIAIPFRSGWAAGLATLLKKLAADNVPHRPELGPAAVAGWWRDHRSAREGLRDATERHVSNWYPIAPTQLYFHELARVGIGALQPATALPYPAIHHNQYLVTFAPASDFASALSPDRSITSTLTWTLGDDPDQEPRLWKVPEERGAVTQLLRGAWKALLASRGLPTHGFANDAIGFYFTKGFAPNDRAWFTSADGSQRWRNMVGHKSLWRPGKPSSLRYWHFCLEAKPTAFPIVGYTMRPHVLFSDDGCTIWTDPARLQKARQSQCANWWNDRWRDLIAAAISWLANGRPSLPLPVGRETSIELPISPTELTSRVAFDDETLGGESQRVDENASDRGDDRGGDDLEAGPETDEIDEEAESADDDAAEDPERDE